MLVNSSFPAKTVPEFIAHAKANPGKINLASNGTGNLTHLSGELFRMMTGIEVVHVPYRGTPAAHSALMAGDVHAMFDAVGTSLPHIQSGGLRALGVTATARLRMLPDIPVIGDVVPGYEVTGWLGIGVPKGTPAEIVERINREVNAALADPTVKARMAELGSEIFTGSSSDFAKHLAEETEKWGKVDPGGQHQAGVARPLAACSVTSRSANGGNDRYWHVETSADVCYLSAFGAQRTSAQRVIRSATLARHKPAGRAPWLPQPRRPFASRTRAGAARPRRSAAGCPPVRDGHAP